ncbi:MAG: ABC-F family ATP-binding cassette domain-containing protein [Hyphomicrobiaceae bacterium]
MLHLNELTYRIEGRLILDAATAGIPSGHKVGLVGRNGTGKTTLLRLIAEEIHADDGTITTPKGHRIGYVEQEAPGGPASLIDWVLAADTERQGLLAEAETAEDPHRIAEIHTRLADMGAHAAPARAATILAGLGFDEAAQARPCSDYSGGWRMRVALAAVLFLEPELLLLDEPTNYLDLEGTLWLESYLKSYAHTVLMVSHDRDLLNRAVTAILHLDRGKLTFYTGGYDAFENARRERQQLDLKLRKKQDEQRRHMQAFVDRFRYKASKARQAQSRLKAIERMQPIAEAVEDRVVPFHFPAPGKGFGNPIIRLDDAQAGYATARPVLRDLNLRIDQDDRIGLLGQNGNGKSTLAKLVAGRLPPMAGKRFGSDKLVIGYFAQHQMDDLPSGLTPYDHMVELMPDATIAERRARLGVYGFGADKADTKAEHLSGGEKARLLFALATFHKPHLLILDEPTNHLDVDSREALIMALNDYEGAVILISHDRHLIEATVDRLWVVRKGTVEAYEGDIEQYRRELLDGLSGRNRGRPKTSTAPASSAARAGQRRDEAQRRAERSPLKKAVEAAERKIAALNEAIAALDKQLADPGLYTREPERAQQVARERGLQIKQREAAEEDWLAASEAFESAEG